MGYIHCCGRLVRAVCFVLSTPVGFTESRLFVVDSCPHCNSFITVLIRVDHASRVDNIRKSNLKARMFFEKLKTSILYKEQSPALQALPASKNYLNYSYFGKIQKCYSNISSLKTGMGDPFSHLDIVDRLNNKGFVKI